MSESTTTTTETAIDGTIRLAPSRPSPPLAPILRRALKHPRVMHYNRLIALVLLVNGALLALHLSRRDWHIADGSALSGLADLIVVNFAIAVLIRQQPVLNMIFALAGRGSSRWPQRLRWTVSKVNHIGGLHVGAALAGTGWLCAFTVVAAVAAATGPRPRISRPSRCPRASGRSSSSWCSARCRPCAHEFTTCSS